MKYEDVQIGMRITSTYYGDHANRHGIVVEKSTRHTGSFTLKFDDGLIGSTQNSYAPEYFKPFDWTKASPEELLEEAKRRYPVGTMIDPPHIKGDGHHCYITGKFLVSGRSVYVSYAGPYESHSVEANSHPYQATVFYGGKWAEIISLPETKSDLYIPIKDRKIFIECMDYIDGEAALSLLASIGVANIHGFGPCKGYFSTDHRFEIKYLSNTGYTCITVSAFRQMVEEELKRNQTHNLEGVASEYITGLGTSGRVAPFTVGSATSNTAYININHKPKTTNNEHKKQGEILKVSRSYPTVTTGDRKRPTAIQGRIRKAESSARHSRHEARSIKG